MSFSSGQSNPPWQRKTLTNSNQSNANNIQPAIAIPSSSLAAYQSSPMYNQNLNLTQQNPNVNFQPINRSLNQQTGTLYPQSISYPTSRGLNSIAFGTNNTSQTNPNTSVSNQNNVGIVTQINNGCGFIDNEIFFNKTAYRGAIPKVGEKVFMEVDMNQNAPFKLAATRLQIMSSTSGSSMRNNPPPPPLMSINATSKSLTYSNNFTTSNDSNINYLSRQQSNRRLISPRRETERNFPEIRPKDEDESERKRHRDNRDKDKKDRRERSIEKKDRSPIHGDSPKRKRTRTTVRYGVQIPKISLIMNNCDVLETRRRYNNLYIPSDFFYSQIRWTEAFPADKPFNIHQPCAFHVMHKSVDRINSSNIIEPTDVDYLFCAKVMLMSTPSLQEFYEKCLPNDNRDLIHPTRLINFLVGTKGKNEAMAIGGPWSPSLDGPNPHEDPTVLIKTAIRTCKALTGIDLSGCTHWYRFLEIYYRRSERNHKNHLIPARVETVVIYLPDVNSCLPNHIEWDNMHHIYKNALDNILNQDNNSDPTKFLSVSSLMTAEDDNSMDVENSTTFLDESSKEKEFENTKSDPIHYSKLDPKNMKIQELRNQLNTRNFSCKGLKPQLVARLSKALNFEKNQENNNMDDKQANNTELISPQDHPVDDTEEEPDDIDFKNVIVLDEYFANENDTPSKNTSKKLDDRERHQLKRRHKLPDMPHIIVHPSKTAKSGKFDCAVMSLSLLLDYRQEDSKEHTFEVSLFAELFNEMLMRDFGFNIFKELYFLPEKGKDKDKDTKDKDEKKSVDENNKQSHDKNLSKEKDRDKHISKIKTVDCNSDDDDYSIKSGDKKRKHKQVLTRPDLLLSFIYFDTTYCGFIYDKDLEDLFNAIGLSLSKAQIKKIINKSSHKDAVYYKKLTMKNTDDNIKTEDTTDKISYISKLAKGNRDFLPIFREKTNNQIKSEQEKQIKIDSIESNETGLVPYNGSLIDIDKLIEQVKRANSAREEVEQLLIELRKQNIDLQSSNNKANSRIKDLNSDAKSLNKKLNEAEQHITSLNKKYHECHNILANIYDKVSPMFSKNDRSTRNESLRTRDREREKDKDREREREKEKDKGKDKEKEENNEIKNEKEP